MIVLEAEILFIRDHQVMFKECFKNSDEDQMESCFSNEVGHCLWLESLVNLLSGE